MVSRDRVLLALSMGFAAGACLAGCGAPDLTYADPNASNHDAGTEVTPDSDAPLLPDTPADLSTEAEMDAANETPIDVAAEYLDEPYPDVSTDPADVLDDGPIDAQDEHLLDVSTDTQDATNDSPIDARVDSQDSSHDVHPDQLDAPNDRLDEVEPTDVTADSSDSPSDHVVEDGPSESGEDVAPNCTDVGCGGTCPPCDAGKQCLVPKDCISLNCVGNVCQHCQPGMVDVPRPGSGHFCIDANEVTQVDYQAWLATNPPDPGLPITCSWKKSFAPSSSGGNCSLASYDPTNKPYSPVVCVDWCDGDAYCLAHGKRLCGRVGGGSVPHDQSYVNADADQWYRACSQAGTRDYPYGTTYASAFCSEGDFPVTVGSSSRCEGGYPGIFDMSGNVAEWEDACWTDTSSKVHCRSRGGSYLSTSSALSCSADNDRRINTRNADLGFRCCLD